VLLLIFVRQAQSYVVVTLGSVLTCYLGEPYMDRTVTLTPVARAACRRQVGEDVKTTIRKRNYMVHFTDLVPAQ
jgi:hypothetical protein